MEIDFGTRLGRFHAPRAFVPKPGEPAGQLYDLVRDRQETTNVYLQNPEIVRDLTSKLERIRLGSKPFGIIAAFGVVSANGSLS